MNKKKRKRRLLDISYNNSIFWEIVGDTNHHVRNPQTITNITQVREDFENISLISIWNHTYEELHGEPKVHHLNDDISFKS